MKTLELRSISRFVTLSLNDPLFSNAPGPDFVIEIAVARCELIAEDMEESKIHLVGSMRIGPVRTTLS